VLPFQGKRPQDAAAVAAVQLCAPLLLQQQQQQHPQHHLEGLPVQMMMMPGGHQSQAVPAAYQAFAMPDTATLIDVQGSFPDSDSHGSFRL
jgi:hypothetical protein